VCCRAGEERRLGRLAEANADQAASGAGDRQRGNRRGHPPESEGRRAWVADPRQRLGRAHEPERMTRGLARGGLGAAARSAAGQEGQREESGDLPGQGRLEERVVEAL